MFILILYFTSKFNQKYFIITTYLYIIYNTYIFIIYFSIKMKIQYLCSLSIILLFYLPYYYKNNGLPHKYFQFRLHTGITIL